MLSTVHTIAINGLDASRVLIEINVTPFSQPRDALYVMVGLPDSAVKESKTRVRSAMENSGYNARGAADVAVNFAPADVKKKVVATICLWLWAYCTHSDKRNFLPTC